MCILAALLGQLIAAAEQEQPLVAAQPLEMPTKAAPRGTAAVAASEHAAARADALARLQETDNDWWDGVEVAVPWAAVSAAHAARDDTWVGIITDAVEKSNSLNSQYTIEDPEFEDEQIVVSGAALAGLEGFGDHDVRVSCDEIDAEVEAAPAGQPQQSQQQPAAPAAAKPRGRPKGSKNKPKAGNSAAASAEDIDIDPLGALCDELDGEAAASKSTGAKLRQGWEYAEYHEDLLAPHLQPERIWGGIKHPRLRRRAYDAAHNT